MTVVQRQRLGEEKEVIRTCEGMHRIYRPAAVRRLMRIMVQQGNRRTALRGFGRVTARELQEYLL
jgi:hypothetical protein